jgi:hypothetical protein
MQVNDRPPGEFLVALLSRIKEVLGDDLVAVYLYSAARRVGTVSNPI